MAVAETPTSAPVTRNPQQQLALHSLLGALLVLLGLGLVFSGLPTLWREAQLATLLNNPFLAEALLIVVTLPVMVGLFLGARHLLGEHPQRGLRAGIVIGVVLLL